VRRVDERLERVESRGDRLVHWKACTEAEAVAAAHHLGHDRVRVRRLRRGDERVDLRLVVDAFAEGIRPEGAELARRGRRSDRRNVWRIQGEQAGQIPKDSRKRGELQTFPILNACNASLTTSLRGRWEPSQASERAF